MTGEVVPFGKYKDEPAETLLADPDYCQWLLAQPWFRDRWPNVYSVVVNYGSEPQDSPEHNQMQARFLVDALCLRLAGLLHPERAGSYGELSALEVLEADARYQAVRDYCELERRPAAIAGRRFESDGWDVVFGIQPAAIHARPSPPPCTCRCDHAGCPDSSYCKGGKRHLDCAHSGHGRWESSRHCDETCHWAARGLSYDQQEWLKRGGGWYQGHWGDLIKVELKPDLGDDYPAVLRQVLRYPLKADDARCVITRRHGFEHVSWEQVRMIFAASRVRLLSESEIDAA
jgi:hypothetical protein